MVMLMLLIANLTISCSSTRVIPSDKVVVRLEAGKLYLPPINGWFVSDARMLEILNKLDK